MAMIVSRMDASKFLSRLDMLEAKRFPDAAREGLKRAGIALMTDTVEQEPTAPRDIPAEDRGRSNRELWGSGAVFVESDKVEVSPFGDPVYQPDQVEKPQPMSAQVVFNAPYAAQWHENQPEGAYADRYGIPTMTGFTYPLAGIKFLENKLIANIHKYASLIADGIRGKL